MGASDGSKLPRSVRAAHQCPAPASPRPRTPFPYGFHAAAPPGVEHPGHKPPLWRRCWVGARPAGQRHTGAGVEWTLAATAAALQSI